MILNVFNIPKTAPAATAGNNRFMLRLPQVLFGVLMISSMVFTSCKTCKCPAYAANNIPNKIQYCAGMYQEVEIAGYIQLPQAEQKSN